MKQGWWDEYTDLGIAPLIGLQNEASHITTYQSCFVPWMFQTEDYARCTRSTEHERMAPVRIA